MEDTKNENVPAWLIPSRVYDVLKWVGLVVFPAVAVFVSTIGAAWGIPYVNEIVLTLNACGVLTGALIGASAIHANIKEGSDEE